MKPIVYFSDDFLIYYRTKFEDMVDLYLEKDLDGIGNIFDNGNRYLNTGMKFKYRRLLTNQNSDLNSTERMKENVKTLYESLKHLTPTQAKDERLWTAMYNKYFLNYLFEYVDNAKKNKSFIKNLKGEIFFTHGIKRSVIVQGLSKLWWVGYHLYDERHDDPYHLIDFFAETGIAGKAIPYFSSSIVSNKNISFGIIEGIQAAVNLGIVKNRRDNYKDALKFLNLQGAVVVLDIYSRQEIKMMVLDYFENEHGKKL